MSNIYIQEPPTNGKVLLSTTVGDIDIELWSKEAPKACKNFVQLCMEGYYDNTIFHRIVKGFICQGGDPTGTGTGGESIYGQPFKDEFHQRLRFNRRGLVAMANAGPNDNQSQFFFTFDRADELNKKHTIFGKLFEFSNTSTFYIMDQRGPANCGTYSLIEQTKVAGNTIYNMIRMEDMDVDENERPLDPPQILKTEVLSNPFDDIEPRRVKQSAGEDKRKEGRPKSQSKATKNYKLLSFGDEAEEDEEETDAVSEKIKIRSTHDIRDDPHLSSQASLDASSPVKGFQAPENHERQTSSADLVRNKLTKNKDNKRRAHEDLTEETRASSFRESGKQREKEAEERLGSPEPKKSKTAATGNRGSQNEGKEKNKNELLQDVLEEKKSFMQKMKKEKALRKGEGRESATLALLAGFKDRLNHVMEEDAPAEAESDWMAHKLQFEADLRQAKDANVKNEDTFDIYDPRNPITKRRRENKSSGKEKKAR